MHHLPFIYIITSQSVRHRIAPSSSELDSSAGLTAGATARYFSSFEHLPRRAGPSSLYTTGSNRIDSNGRGLDQTKDQTTG